MLLTKPLPGLLAGEFQMSIFGSHLFVHEAAQNKNATSALIEQHIRESVKVANLASIVITGAHSLRVYCVRPAKNCAKTAVKALGFQASLLRKYVRLSNCLYQIDDTNVANNFDMHRFARFFITQIHHSSTNAMKRRRLVSTQTLKTRKCVQSRLQALTRQCSKVLFAVLALSYQQEYR